ncbi:hypothetical protein CK203_048850 [Vitis vinifera]|uniref:DUF4216 domain-containing protein n=1 Tax=Vitis vinifera TaxID=29760 RepID=A0A438FMA1_VITVI|nr:hypothetical protein CK203_048850 [Vitis vinifera]
MSFIAEYLSNVETIGIPSTSNIDQKVGASLFGGHTVKVDSNLWLQAHHYVLENTTIIQPYVEIQIFKCDWVDNKNGIRVDDLGFTLVDFSKIAYKLDPFILAPKLSKFSMYKMNFIQDGQLFYQLLNKTSWKGTRASFTLDGKSMRNCMLTMGKCFRSFKNMLTMVATGYTKIIDRNILWKKAMEKKDGTYDEVFILVVKKIVRKCQLAIGTKENVVAAGTIILECSVNFLVVVDASYKLNAPLSVPISNQITTIGDALGYQVLWPAQMVSLTTHPIQDSKKFKKQRNEETRLSSKDENPIDIKNFATLVGLLLKEGKLWFPKLEWGKQARKVGQGLLLID